ncbi:MAG: GGDEF domain-containing protein [Nitrospirae bacterium]|nr:GGDEF domain-containing protein [Nitrospirota bacterium]
MNQEIDLKDLDLAAFEEKVYVIADEVLVILKELSRENQKQISSKLIAEKMFNKDTVKCVLVNNGIASSNTEIDRLKEIANVILDRFTELVPSHMTDKFDTLKNMFNNNAAAINAKDWLDSPIDILRKYIGSLSDRNNEVEEFLKQTMQYLAAIEQPLTGELASQQQKFRDERAFEEDLTSYINMMRQDCNHHTDINALKAAFLNKIENINKGIEQKREQDIQRLKDAEKTLGEMWERMNEIKHEAEEIRKKSQEMEFESYHDALTGIYNRRAYDEKIEEILAHVQRYDIPATLMICDIDFFKKINDKFGHKIGDLALKKLADLLKERLRKNDFIARYGGEEFAIILPHTDLNGAKIAGESVRSYIDKSVFSYKGQKIPLTISAGVSSFKKDDDITTVFERADKALYLAKKSGRNLVRTDEDVLAEATAPNLLKQNH